MDKVSTVETDEPILAAGGIVWRCDPNPTVAIVHRKRHGGDWVLPKGKSEPGEGLRATALREAVEETGCAVTAHELLGSISYEANGRRKIVHFWRMEAGEPVQAIDSEVDQVRWLPLEAAVDALTYPQESDFLRSTVKNGVTFGWLGSIPLRHRFFETSTARLRKATTSLQIDLRRVIGRAGAEQNWTYDAWLLIDRVRRAIEERDAGLGWQCHKHADRLRLHGLGEQELRLTAQRLVNEAEKLPSWRSNTVKQILLEDGHLKSSISAIEVAEAARLVHENEDNTYRRLRLRSLQFAFLGIAALIFLTCYTALVRFSGPNGDLVTWGYCRSLVAWSPWRSSQRYSADR
jgi:8-oxo-dGTP pyrophosphatase MutT (NUDIX family)